MRSSKWVLTVAAFDDQTSTSIIPTGAGVEVVFCPGARSTDIIDTSQEAMQYLLQRGRINKHQALISRNAMEQMFKRDAEASITPSSSTALLMVSSVAGLCSRPFLDSLEEIGDGILFLFASHRCIDRVFSAVG
jgi:hypothetical protein